MTILTLARRARLPRRAWKRVGLIAVVAAMAVVAGPAVAFGSSGVTVLCHETDYSCVSSTDYQGSPVWGSWGPGHNCVSYAGYRLQQNGAAKPWMSNIGNADQWDEKAVAAGFLVDTSPTRGSIAQWDTGSAGHVAYVEVVTATHIEVSEDSYLTSTTGYTSRRRLDRSGTVFASAEFIHIKDSPDITATGRSFSGDNKADLLWYEAGINSGQAKVVTTNTVGTGTATSTPWVWGYSQADWSGRGDFNGDGFTDLVWYEGWNGGTAKVLFSNGVTFASSTVWFTGFGAPNWATVADFTGDGKADIGWYEAWNNGGTLKVISTNSSGTGMGTHYTWFSGFSSPDYAGSGDFTGDGKADILWYEAWNNGTAKVFSTNSSGTGSGNQYTWFSGYSAANIATVG